jgi:putative aldouronate transport system substrate-binding protein
MKTKLIAILSAAAMMLSMMVGCGSSASSDAASSTTVQSASEPSTSEESAASELDVSEEAQSAAADATEAMEETLKDAMPADELPEGVEPQASMTDATAAILEEAVKSANAISSEEYPEAQKSDNWKFVESDEYQAGMKEVRADIDAVMPGSDVLYNAEGQLLSSKGVIYDYPLAEEHSITAFAVNRGLTSNYVSDFSELITFQIASSETGIDVNFTTVPGDAAETQMNLIFASGDFPDLVSYFTAAYSGTPASAYENDLIVPLNDYLADYSPNYRAWIETNDTYLKSVTSDDGNIYCWYSLNAAPAVEQGSWVRADLIDKFGIDVPTTVSEMEDYFALCKDEGLSSVISCNAYGFMIFSDAFDVPSLSADNGFGIGLFREGNTVESILSADNSDKLKTYMETLHQWYENGYYAADLVSFTSSDDTNINNLIYNGETGYMWSGSGHYANYVQQAAVEGWDIEPTPNIVLNSGDTTHYLANDVIKTNVGSIVMTSACEDIEAACRYVDWFYSDMGINITNYGPEGLTWNWSSDGTSRLFSSAVYADEVYGLGSAPVMMMYNGSTTWASIADSLYNLYYGSSMIAIECQKLWSQNTDSEKYLSTGALSLTTSESEQASTIQSDLNTYLEESLTKFLTGDLSLDTDWDGFISTIEGMGLQDVVDIYQDAYDRYLDR